MCQLGLEDRGPDAQRFGRLVISEGLFELVYNAVCISRAMEFGVLKTLFSINTTTLKLHQLNKRVEAEHSIQPTKPG